MSVNKIKNINIDKIVIDNNAEIIGGKIDLLASWTGETS